MIYLLFLFLPLISTNILRFEEKKEECEEFGRKVVQCSSVDAYQKFVLEKPEFNDLILTNCSFLSQSKPNENESLNTTSLMKMNKLTFDCEVTQVLWPLRYQFPRLSHVSFPRCKLTKLPWQYIYSLWLKSVDVTDCPITCTCDNVWMMHGTQNRNLDSVPLSLRRCQSDCQRGQLIAPNTIQPNVGEPLEIDVEVKGETFKTIKKNVKYFIWVLADEHHTFEEEISLNHLKIIMENVTNQEMGVIVALCWHCVDYAVARIELQIETPMEAWLQGGTPADTDVLDVHGYPIDNLTLTIVELDGRNKTETKELVERDTYFFESLIVRATERALFYHRTFHVFGTVTEDFHYVLGDMIFTFCNLETCVSVNKTTKRPEMTLISHSNTEDSKGKRLSKLAVISVLFAIMVFLVFSTVYSRKCIFKCCRKQINNIRKKLAWASRLQSRRASRETEETLLRLEERSSLSSSDYTNQIIPFIDIGNITIHERIGKGAFGEVYCGSWEKLGDRSVAVKTIKQADSEVEKEALVVSRLDHRNIVRLYGMTRDQGNLLLVFELMNLGDLRTYLRARVPQSSNYSQFPPALTEIELKRIIIDIVSAVCYMAAQQIVHRDLAARNCLVSGESDAKVCLPSQRPEITVKISDFGMSRHLYSTTDYYRMEHQSLLPVRWLPPEAITDHKFSHMSDIWSLGVTMWEIFSYGQVPFSELSNHEVVSYAIAGVKPPQTKCCPNEMYALMMKCWKVKPEDRISADEILLDRIFEECQRMPTVNSIGAGPSRLMPTSLANRTDLTRTDLNRTEEEEHSF